MVVGEEEVVQVVSGGSGFFSKLKLIFGGLFSLMWLKWRYTITILFILFLLATAIPESVRQGSLAPLVFEIGGRIVSSDEVLYQNNIKLEKNDFTIPVEIKGESSFNVVRVMWAKFKFILSVLSCFWFMYIMGYMFYKFFMLFEDRQINAIVLAIFLMIFLQMSFSLAMLHINSIENPVTDKVTAYKDVSFALIPLKGIGRFAINIPKIIELTIWRDYLQNSILVIGSNNFRNQTYSGDVA